MTSLLAGIRRATSLLARIRDKAILIGWDLNKWIYIMNPLVASFRKDKSLLSTYKSTSGKCLLLR